MDKADRDTLIDLDIGEPSFDLETVPPEAGPSPEEGGMGPKTEGAASKSRGRLSDVEVEDDGVAPNLVGMLLRTQDKETATGDEGGTAAGDADNSNDGEGEASGRGDTPGHEDKQGSQKPEKTSPRKGGARPALSPPSPAAESPHGPDEKAPVPAPSRGDGEPRPAKEPVGDSGSSLDRPRLPFVLALIATLAAVTGVAVHLSTRDDPGASFATASSEFHVEVTVGVPRLISADEDREVPTGSGEGATGEASALQESGRPAGMPEVLESVIPISVQPNGEVRQPVSAGRRSGGRRRAQTGDPLPAAVVLETVSSNTDSVRRCHEREMRRTGGPIEARVLVRMRVEPSGAVGAVSAAGDSTSPRLDRCIEDAIRGWVFAESTGATEIETPFSLTARQ